MGEEPLKRFCIGYFIMGAEDFFCVIGAGRIGLPISVTLASRGMKVLILEKDEGRCSMINDSESPFYEEGMDGELKKAIDRGLLSATRDPSRISDCNIFISAIGTGVMEDGTPDISGIDALDKLVSPRLNAGDTLILKTTLPIGTTEEIARIIADSTGLQLDEDLFVAFCPERIVEGRAMHELEVLPKIIGGIGPKSASRVSEIMEIMGGEVVVVSDSRTAEMCKLLDNAYRMTRFGFSADVASVAWRNGIDAYEAINAANFQYERNNIPLPSIGVSGYCLTKDPYYLDAGASELWTERGFPSTWISARRAADMQIEEAVTRISQELPGGLSGKRVVIAGATYKENIDDIRLSHGREIASKLTDEGARVSFWDPCVSEESIDGFDVSHNEGCLKSSDTLIITVPHKEFIDWAKNPIELEEMGEYLIFDGWGIFSGVEMSSLNVRIIGTGV